MNINHDISSKFVSIENKVLHMYLNAGNKRINKLANLCHITAALFKGILSLPFKHDLRYTNSVKLISNFYKILEYKYFLYPLNSNKKRIRRLAGLGLGVSLGITSIVGRTATVVETVFKGFANIFSASFTKKGSFKNGAKQLFFKLPINIMKMVYSPILAVFKCGLLIAQPRTFSIIELCAISKSFINGAIKRKQFPEKF